MDTPRLRSQAFCKEDPTGFAAPFRYTYTLTCRHEDRVIYRRSILISHVNLFTVEQRRGTKRHPRRRQRRSFVEGARRRQRCRHTFQAQATSEEHGTKRGAHSKSDPTHASREPPRTFAIPSSVFVTFAIPFPSSRGRRFLATRLGRSRSLLSRSSAPQFFRFLALFGKFQFLSATDVELRRAVQTGASGRKRSIFTLNRETRFL